MSKVEMGICSSRSGSKVVDAPGPVDVSGSVVASVDVSGSVVASVDVSGSSVDVDAAVVAAMVAAVVDASDSLIAAVATPVKDVPSV